jgi:hypothetical protein
VLAAGALLAAYSPAVAPNTPVSAPAAASPPAVTPSPAVTPPALTEHKVSVSVSGDPGTVFRVHGEVFGDTGGVDLPSAGTDSAGFTTTKSVSQLDLGVTVVGDNATCSITFDDQQIAAPVIAPDSTAAICSTRSA